MPAIDRQSLVTAKGIWKPAHKALAIGKSELYCGLADGKHGAVHPVFADGVPQGKYLSA